MVAPVAVSEVSAVPAPTAPVMVTVPPVPPVRTRAWALLIVLVNEMFAPAAVPPALVGSTVTPELSNTGPVIVTMPPLVVWLPPRLMAVVPV